MTIDADLDQALARLETEGLLRNLRTVEGRQGPEITIDGKLVTCFSSNNYLGLADDPRLCSAITEALAHTGLGSGASRLISGTMSHHRQAERALASFVRTKSALLFSTGYAANLGLLSALMDEEDVIFSDALNHASIIDGCRLSRATVHVFPHRDMDALAQLLAQHRPPARRAIVITDTVFSMDGVRAPLGRLRALSDAADAWLVVDEAHSIGVLGPKGRGACAEARVRPDALVGTLGKAFGVAGAFVAGSHSLTRYLENRARSFVFSTAPPPAWAAAITCATGLVEAADARRQTLMAHAEQLRTELRAMGYDARGEQTPIVPVHLGDPALTMRLSQRLLQRGHLAQGIRPPTVPEGTSRIRLVPMATHEPRHVEQLLTAFRELRGEALQ